MVHKKYICILCNSLVTSSIRVWYVCMSTQWNNVRMCVSSEIWPMCATVTWNNRTTSRPVTRWGMMCHIYRCLNINGGGCRSVWFGWRGPRTKVCSILTLVCNANHFTLTPFHQERFVISQKSSFFFFFW